MDSTINSIEINNGYDFYKVGENINHIVNSKKVCLKIIKIEKGKSENEFIVTTEKDKTGRYIKVIVYG